jgi:hypothetical protein
MRGKLINPFLAELAQLDTAATDEDPDGTGDHVSGYDDDFREPVRYSDGTEAGVDARKEADHIFVPCQIEPEVFDALNMIVSGDVPNAKLGLVFHYADLEQMGLVDATTGQPLIRKNDRLVAIRECDGTLIETIPDPPGLFATEPQSRGYGLSGGKRNLLLVTFEDREHGLLKGQ